jgi:ABC-2 type transport system permease protein
MRRIVGAIVGKELREIWRDPLSLSLSLLLPLLLLALFAYGLNLDVGRVRLGVYDNDRSGSSRDYLASLTASDDLVVWGEAASVADLEAWLDRGSVDAGLIVPPDFERSLTGGRPAELQALVDGSFPPRAKAILAQLDAAAAMYSQRLFSERVRLSESGVKAGPLVVAEPRVWFNPELKSVNYVVPGLFSLILMTFIPLLSTLAIVRERERGSIQQILAAPMSPLALILGKALP